MIGLYSEGELPGGQYIGGRLGLNVQRSFETEDSPGTAVGTLPVENIL